MQCALIVFIENLVNLVLFILNLKYKYFNHGVWLSVKCYIYIKKRNSTTIININKCTYVEISKIYMNFGICEILKQSTIIILKNKCVLFYVFYKVTNNIWFMQIV